MQVNAEQMAAGKECFSSLDEVLSKKETANVRNCVLKLYITYIMEQSMFHNSCSFT